MNFDMSFYKDKKVLITGHTGFKGSWMTVMLVNAGAKVIGYSSCRKEKISLFDMCEVKDQIVHIKGDIRDIDCVVKTMKIYKPEIVIHMAAQPLVRESFLNPVETYDTNVIGTVNICEAIRQCDSVKSFVNVTTDKVYENQEWEWGYRENDVLNGYDPYSNSKSCSELVTQCYIRSFLKCRGVAVSTVRAGNVIGGGDFAKDRIIPDCIKAAINNEDIIVRNPYSIRPYQHVLEPVYVYLMIAAMQYQDISVAGHYNVGPSDDDCYSTGDLVNLFVEKWGNGINWRSRNDGGPHEATYLKLDCSKLMHAFNWRPHWSLDTAVEKVIEWTKCWDGGENIRACMNDEIADFLNVRI